MSIASLIDQFPLLATAPEGVKRLRELILDLAVHGRLVAGQKPSEWLESTLSEAGEWGSGGTPLKGNSEYYGGNIPWLVIGDLNDGLVTEAANRITEKGLSNSSAKLVPAGTLLVAMYGSIGKLGITGIECATNQAIAYCKPDTTKITLQFLFYYLKAIRPRLVSRGQGLAQQNISQKILKGVEIRLPPLVDQERIVAKVDELIALCDRLEAQQADAASAHATLVKTLLDTLTQSQSAADFAANWQRLAQHFDTLFTTEASIDTLKQTLLQLAVMGKLVPQDPSDEPASELLKRIQAEKAKLVAEGKIKRDKPLQEISEDEKPFDLPAGWKWVRMQTAFDVRDGTHDTPKYVDADGVPLITSRNFQSGKICFDDAKLISWIDHEDIKKRSSVDKGDILYSMIGGNIGNQVLVDTDREFSIKNVALFKYYSKQDTLPQYLDLFLRTVTIGLQGRAVGGAQPFVSLGLLRNIPFALPPIPEQHRIVAKVDELMALCDQLAAHLKAAHELAAHYATAATEAVLEAA